MKNGKVNQFGKPKLQPTGLVLTFEEKKRLTDFFVLLIEIDRRKKVTKIYEKSIK